MKYEIKHVNDCTKKFLFNLENINLDPYLHKAALSKQGTVQIKGFRKGKAPIAMIQDLYKGEITNDALYKIVMENVDTAIKTEKLNPIDYPKIENTSFENSELKFEATIEVFPEIKLKDYKNYKFKRDKIEVTNDEIEDSKNKILEKRATLVAQSESYPAQNHDFVVINFEGELADGNRPENMKGQDYPLEIGSNSFIPGFETALIGLKKGESKKVKLTFPMEYQVESLKGVDVTFDVSLLEVKKKILPEFTDDLAKELGAGSKDEMIKKISSEILKQKQFNQNKSLEKDFLEKVLADNKFEVPESMVTAQKKSSMEQMINNLKRSGMSDEVLRGYFEKNNGEIETRALFQVKSAFVLDTLSKAMKIEVKDEDINKKYQELALSSGLSIQEISDYYKKNQSAYKNFFFAIKEEKTFEKLFMELIG